MENLKTFRRDLHQIPEIGLQEFKTQLYLSKQLKKMGYNPIEVFNTGLYVFIDYGNNETIMFRSDIDALPITENNMVDYASTHPGYMHACGHDGHMSMLLGFADYLKDQKHFNRNVLLVFQPAEEGPGGANEIVKSGILEKFNVTEVYGIHLFPNYPEGTIVSKSGPLMASITIFDIKIHGVSSHVAMPNEGIDALYYGSLFYTELCNILTSSLHPDDYILKFGKMSSGTARNIVSNLTCFEGTIRTLSIDVRKQISDTIIQLKTQYETSYGVTIDLVLEDLYPVVNNDPELYQKLKNIVSVDHNFVELEKPLMISEDFSFYQQACKGVFYFLGTNNPKLGFTYLLHNDQFNFNESVLQVGVDTYKKLISSY